MHEQQVGGLRACAGDPRCRGPAFITRSYFSATNYPRSKVQTLDCVSHGPDKMRRVVIGHISNWEMVNCVEYVCTYIWIWASCQLCGEPAQKGRTIEWKRLFACLWHALYKHSVVSPFSFWYQAGLPPHTAILFHIARSQEKGNISK